MDDNEDLHSVEKINRETAKLLWTELEPHFASGSLVSVDNSLDLVRVAKAVADDDTAAIKQWMAQGTVNPTSDQQALAWQQSNAELWAVVIKPLILVQPV